MVATSEFIVVRTGPERLIWPEKRSVCTCAWSVVKSSSFFVFSGKMPARLLLLHQKGLEPGLEGDPQTPIMGCTGLVLRTQTHGS